MRIEVLHHCLLPKIFWMRTERNFMVLRQKDDWYLLRMPNGIGHRFNSDVYAWWVPVNSCRVTEVISEEDVAAGW